MNEFITKNKNKKIRPLSEQSLI